MLVEGPERALQRPAGSHLSARGRNAEKTDQLREGYRLLVLPAGRIDPAQQQV